MRYTAGFFGLLSSACSMTHAAPQPPIACDPDAGATGCPEGLVCFPNVEGDHVCLKECDAYREGAVCASGEACAPRSPDPPPLFVCWPGGRGARGETCEGVRQCARGLLCNADHVCEEACNRLDYDCRTPGTVCHHGVCAAPRLPVGAPCSEDTDCAAAYSRCGAETAFTCQPSCINGLSDPSRARTCLAGGPCNEDGDCPLGPIEPVDACERTPSGSLGCRERQVCAMTSRGVRRCMDAGCRPDGSGEVRCRDACLPDPEDPAIHVCWLGGTVRRGEACATSYECALGDACGREGVCRDACTEEGAPCHLEGQVCRNFVCTVEGS